MTRPCKRSLLCCLWVALGGLGTACPSSTGNGQDSSGLADLAVADQRTGDVDLRPGDLASTDLASTDLASTDLASTDLAPGDASAPDAAVADSASGPDLTAGDVTLAEGPCSGRAGHTCTGQIGLYRTPGGALELRFPSNFRVSQIPAGEVYLSSRSALGSSINPGGTSTDVFLGTLQAFTGAQTYAVTAGTEAGRPFAWIWCRAATVEVGVAPLTSLP
jgi:hypothetical protein